MSEERAGWLRGRGDGAAEVAPIELFFDLVYVLAITQLTHHLLDHLTTRGTLQTLLLLLAIWWAWIDTAWFTNFFNPGTRPVRFLLLAAMLIDSGDGGELWRATGLGRHHRRVRGCVHRQRHALVDLLRSRRRSRPATEWPPQPTK